MFVHVLLLALTQLLTLATTEHVVYNGKTLEGGEGACPGDQQTGTVLDEIDTEVRGVVRDTILPARIPGFLPSRPANSCSEIAELHPGLPSHYYWLRSRSGTAVQVFCDRDRVCGCNIVGGWTRVANLNMRNPSHQCPGEWIMQTRSSEPRRLCGRNSSSGVGCLSAVYSTYSISYSHVCGRVIGYQYNSPDAFSQHTGPQTIEGPYMDGVSVTHGLPGTRQHIWTFAAGLSEMDLYSFTCPCVGGTAAPSYVGNDYFCESANPNTTWTSVLYASDPLWDGQGCGSPPCCELSSPPGTTVPWFCKQLSQATTDDIEVRICGNEHTSNEDVPVELIELYIH